MKMLDQTRLREVLTYDPFTGEFRWRGKPNGRVAECAIAGTVTPKGYRRIQIDGVIYQAGPLAVLYMTGSLPPTGMEVDHVDESGPKSDNRWSNLRVGTKSQNQQNLKADTARSRAGCRGAAFHKSTGRFAAYIFFNGRHRHLGLFDTMALAGEFAALGRALCMPASLEARNV